MMGTASELRTKIGKLKKRRMEESKLTKVEEVHTNGDISHHHNGRFFKLLHDQSIWFSIVEGEYLSHVVDACFSSAGFSNAKLDDIQELLADLKAL